MSLSTKPLRKDPEYKELKRRLESGVYSLNVQEIDDKVLDLFKTRTFRALKVKVSRGSDQARISQTEMLDAIQREAKVRTELFEVRYKLMRNIDLLDRNIDALQERLLDKYSDYMSKITTKTGKVEFVNLILTRAWDQLKELQSLDRRLVEAIKDIDQNGFNMAHFKDVLSMSMVRERNI